MDWLWGKVLLELQPIADREGFGAEWKTMTDLRTPAAAEAAVAAVAAVAAEDFWTKVDPCALLSNLIDV